MPSEERDHPACVAGQWLQGESVLKFSKIEGCRLSKLACRAVHLPKDFLQIEKNLHSRREPDSRRAGQVTIVAAVGAEAVWREVPIIRTGIATLLAKSHRTAMLAEHERLLAAIMQPQWIGCAQIDSIVRSAKRFDDLCVRVSRTNPCDRAAMALGAIAPLCQHDPWKAETAAQAVADNLLSVHRRRT